MDEKLHQTYRKIEGTHWWFIGRRQLVFDILKKRAPADAKILDYGCNTGFLVNVLQRAGFDACGCDKSAEAICFGQAQGTKNICATDGDVLPYRDGEVDVILCLDVLEHLADDRQGLREIRRVLKPGGLAIITVPAFNFLWGLQDEVSHHFRRYRVFQSEDLIKQENLKIEKLSYFNFFLFAPIVLMRLAQKFYRPKRGSDFELNNRFVNKILEKIFLLEIKFLRRVNFPFGVSLLAILKKNEE